MVPGIVLFMMKPRKYYKALSDPADPGLAGFPTPPVFLDMPSVAQDYWLERIEALVPTDGLPAGLRELSELLDALDALDELERLGSVQGLPEEVTDAAS